MLTTSLKCLRRQSVPVTTMRDLTMEWTESTSNAQRLVNVSQSGVTKNMPAKARNLILTFYHMHMLYL